MSYRHISIQLKQINWHNAPSAVNPLLFAFFCNYPVSVLLNCCCWCTLHYKIITQREISLAYICIPPLTWMGYQLRWTEEVVLFPAMAGNSPSNILVGGICINSQFCDPHGLAFIHHSCIISPPPWNRFVSNHFLRRNFSY